MADLGHVLYLPTTVTFKKVMAVVPWHETGAWKDHTINVLEIFKVHMVSQASKELPSMQFRFVHVFSALIPVQNVVVQYKMKPRSTYAHVCI